MKMNKKGITLVEVIVVLVIMAVLAGILVASYTGYIEKAKNDQALVEARAAYLAASTYYHEEFAAGNAKENEWNPGDTMLSKIKDLAGVGGSITVDEVSGGKITKMTYTVSGKTYALEDGAWTSAPATTSAG